MRAGYKRLPQLISEKVGDALLGVTANQPVCPPFRKSISAITLVTAQK